jgi:hypothetical protein
MTFNDLSRSALLLACLAMLSACGRLDAGQDLAGDAAAIRSQLGAAGEVQVSSGIHYGTAEAPAPECRVGDADAAAGQWIDASGSSVAFDRWRRITLSFGGPLAADSLRASLNRAAVNALDTVEFEDGKGAWHKVREGPLRIPAEGKCDQVWLEQPLGRQQIVQALRFTFRAGPGEVGVGNAALLRAGSGQQ